MIVDRVYINCALRSLFYQLSQVNSEQMNCLLLLGSWNDDWERNIRSCFSYGKTI